MKLTGTLEKWYSTEIRVLEYVRHVFVLIIRLYFGYEFIMAGAGKLFNVEATTGTFRDWGIPMPLLNVYMAGTTETVCGFLLMIGFASRLITIPLIGTMVVAYLTAHTEQFYALFDNTAYFFKAPPFPYLFTCLVVLLYGPGRLSIDGMIGAHLKCDHGTAAAQPQLSAACDATPAPAFPSITPRQEGYS